MRIKITYRKTKDGYHGRCGKYHIHMKRTKHYTIEGFETFRSWWTCGISINGKWIRSEGIFGTSLNTLKKAKKWVRSALIQISNTTVNHEQPKAVQ